MLDPRSPLYQFYRVRSRFEDSLAEIEAALDGDAIEIGLQVSAILSFAEELNDMRQLLSDFAISQQFKHLDETQASEPR